MLILVLMPLLGLVKINSEGKLAIAIVEWLKL